MNPVLNQPVSVTDDRDDRTPQLDVQSMALLNQLRFQSIACRAERHLGFYEACQLIQADRSLAVEGLIDALVRILGEAIDKTPVIHAPGCGELSFDEKWLMQMFERAAADDIDSVIFLVKRRVNRYKQRSFMMLVTSLSKAKQAS